MTEVRRTALCDPMLKVTHPMAEYLPHLEAVFEGFLEYVDRTHPELSSRWREAVAARFAQIVADEGLAAPSEGALALLPPLGPLQQDRLSYSLQLLEIRDDDPVDAEVSRIAVTRGRLYPMYQQVRIFCDLLGRERALPSVERYIDEWMAGRTKADPSQQDLQRFWDRLEGPIHETAEVAVRIHRGKIAARVEKCLWADVMRPLEDPEVVHAFTCYGDFSQLRAINPSFVLTRTMTLMQGAPFCDSCLHQRRRLPRHAELNAQLVHSATAPDLMGPRWHFLG